MFPYRLPLSHNQPYSFSAELHFSEKTNQDLQRNTPSIKENQQKAVKKEQWQIEVNNQ